MDTQDFNEKFRNVNLKFIEKKDCDEIIYNSCIKEIEVKEFSIEFSPRFNILGDVVGKILGAAQKSKSPVLMMNRRLLNEARKTIPVLDTAKKYAKMKRDFFDETIPGLKRTSGIRTFIGIIIGGTGFMYGNLPLTALGFVFAVLDP